MTQHLLNKEHKCLTTKHKEWCYIVLIYCTTNDSITQSVNCKLADSYDARSGRSLMLIDAPPTLLNTIPVIYKKHLCHLMAKSMNELVIRALLIYFYACMWFCCFGCMVLCLTFLQAARALLLNWPQAYYPLFVWSKVPEVLKNWL